MKAVDERLGGFDHRSREGQHSLAREERRQRTELKLPLIAFHSEQPVCQSCRKHAPLQPILLIVLGVRHQHPPDGGWLIDYRNAAYRQSRRNDRFLEMGCSPRFERAAGKDPKQRNCPRACSLGIGAGGLRSAAKSSNKLLLRSMNRTNTVNWNTSAQRTTDQRSSIMLKFE